MKYNLGCEKPVRMNTSSGFFCGIPNAWGQEQFCPECKKKLKAKWKEEDLEKTLLKKLKGGKK